MKKLILGTIITAIFLVALSIGVYFWWTNQLAPLQPGNTTQVNFVISQDQTATSVLEELKSKNIIKSPLVARIYLRLTNQGQNIRPGAYFVSPGQDLKSIIATITSGPKDIWVTIPEGWRREQIASRLQSNLSNFNSTEFLQKTTNLEGQLFPDTYLIPTYTTVDDVLAMFQANLNRKAQIDPQATYTINNGTDTHQLTGIEILNLAAMVEREAKHDQDRGLIAGVLLNRLNIDMALQIDATVQYATDTSKCRSTPLDCKYWEPITNTRFPSQFNTYLHPGLPPAPIANPGLATINAVKNPTPSDYVYYLTDPQGTTHYSKTLSEHNLNVDKYLRP